MTDENDDPPGPFPLITFGDPSMCPPATAEDEIGTEIAFGRPVDHVAEILAKRWGVSVAAAARRVNVFMSERAARVMTRMRTDIPAIYSEHRDRLMLVFRRSMERQTQDGRSIPDLHVALKSAIALAQIDGFLTPRQIEMTVALRQNQIPTIEDAEFMRQVEAIIEGQREGRRKSEPKDDDVIDV